MAVLRDVTVVAVDGVARELTQWAIDETLKQIEPRAVLFPAECPQSALEADQLLWRTCAKAKTSHCLVVQYDGWTLDGSMWRPEYLEYDYIGAPWPHRGFGVGNGGFSLRSTAMMRHLVKNLPCSTPEDEAIFVWNPEGHGFKVAPTSLAFQFSFERSPKRRSLGFHGIQNVKRVLPKPKLDEWLALANDYVKSKPEWHELQQDLAA